MVNKFNKAGYKYLVYNLGMFANIRSMKTIDCDQGLMGSLYNVCLVCVYNDSSTTIALYTLL